MHAVISLALLAHGIGHALFAGNALGYWRTASATTASDGLAAVLFVATLTAFVGAAWGYWSEAAWWSTATLVGAVASALLVLAGWGTLNTSSSIFALLFDAAVLVGLLWHGRTTFAG